MSYKLISDYKDNERYRKSLSALAKRIYGFDFEQWYQMGWWGKRYVPYSIASEGEVVANASVNKLEFIIDGEIRHSLQIGTVMTDEAHRNKGLSRELMNVILDEFSGKYETIYLYANPSVIEFYPKFGFVRDKEYVHSRIFEKKGPSYTVRKLDPSNKEDMQLMIRLICGALPSYRISMVDNPGLVMFYFINFMKENFYYIEEMDAAAAASYEEEGLYLTDVFSDRGYDLASVIYALMDKPEMKVTLGFTPFDTSFECEELAEEDTTFFVLGKNPLGKGRYPAMSRA